MAKKKQNDNTTQPYGETHTVHLIAASTGELVTGLVMGAITQFPEIKFDIVSHLLQDNNEKLEATLDNLSGKRPIVMHALADPTAKMMVRNKCVLQRIPHFDVTGPLINFISDCVGVLPQNDVSRLHRLDSAYQRRIEAMEFALEHDDSLGMHSLHDADIVIVGISRVSKSPTTLYLGSRGYKVANVSIVPEAGPPEELDKVAKKVVAFTMQPKRLQEIRSERAGRIGSDSTSYEDLQSVIREVMAAEAEYRRRGYPIIDVTNITIEQSAAQILEVLKPKAK